MNPCLLWDGARCGDGYGWWAGGKRGVGMLAHRYVFERASGEALGDDEIDHLCHNRLCVEITHLRRVPKGFNVKQGNQVRTAAQRAATECANGHPYDETNTYWRPNAPGTRDCRECIRERGRRYKARRRAAA